MKYLTISFLLATVWAFAKTDEINSRNSESYSIVCLSVPLILRGDFRELGFFDIQNISTKEIFPTQVVRSNIAFIGNIPPGEYAVVRIGLKTEDGIFKKLAFTRPIQLNGGVYYLGECISSGFQTRIGGRNAIMVTNFEISKDSITNLSIISNYISELPQWRSGKIFDFSKQML